MSVAYFLMQVGDTVPNFELQANDGTLITLESFKNKKNIVLCFDSGSFTSFN